MWELNAFVHEEYLEECLEISAVYVCWLFLLLRKQQSQSL